MDTGVRERLAAGIRKPLPPEHFVEHDTNAEMRWDVPHGPGDTTAGRLFVRNHTSTPVIDPATYRLAVSGDGVDLAGSEPVLLTLDDLRRLPVTRITALHECTGNGRSYFTTQQGQAVPGTPWRMGGVGAVTWEGVRLAEVLERLDVREDAVDVMAAGLDDSYVDDEGVDNGPVRRPLPIAKALDDALLAWGMNGAPLLPDHGFPLRLVVPGWVGVASIKWLGSLEVATRQLESPWNTKWYRMTGGDFPADAPPLTHNPVRSVWELPEPAVLQAEPGTLLPGRSWSGTGAIERVEVSVDGGATWSDAELDPVGEAWTTWLFRWPGATPGDHVLMARATDVTGATQPLVARWNNEGYLFDAVARHPVVVG